MDRNLRKLVQFFQSPYWSLNHFSRWLIYLINPLRVRVDNLLSVFHFPTDAALEFLLKLHPHPLLYLRKIGKYRQRFVLRSRIYLKPHVLNERKMIVGLCHVKDNSFLEYIIITLNVRATFKRKKGQNVTIKQNLYTLKWSKLKFYYL